MKPKKNRELEAKLAIFRQKFQQQPQEAAKVVFPDLLKFLVALGSEGEQSAVVLGAERNLSFAFSLSASVEAGFFWSYDAAGNLARVPEFPLSLSVRFRP